MIESEKTGETPDGPMTVSTRRPDGNGPFPVVVVYHDGPGIRDDIHDVTRKLADAGYYAILPDLYFRIGKQITFDMEGVAKGPGSPEFDRLIAAVTSLDDALVLRDTGLALTDVAKDPAASLAHKMAMGFCIGARLLIRLLASDPQGFVAGAAMHPSHCVTEEADSPHKAVSRIEAELFVGFGGADTLSSLALNAPLREALKGATASTEIFDGAEHGFMFPRYRSYQERAATISWERTLELFGRRR